MRALIITWIIFFCLSANVFSLGERIPAGGRSAGMGGASVAMIDFWSISNNPAGSAWVEKMSTGIYCENRFLLKALFFEKFGFVLPTKAGTFGVVAEHAGTGNYNEIKAGFTYARKFGRYFTAGITADYLGLILPEEYGRKNMISCEFGLLFVPNKRISAGVHIVNPVPIKITTQPVELLPTVVCLGMTYSFSGSFLASIEAEKDLLHFPVFRLGAEYHIAKAFYGRIGVSINPIQFDFGFGLEFGPVKIDMASAYQQILGFSPSCSFVYCF
ncbi:MAG: hypothetical protein M0P58_06160 [Bacteroidales bacterium]|nr:hypothetical protein [Bacteroidales bacterium]